jgi:DNA-binding NtrC family response regulator
MDDFNFLHSAINSTKNSNYFPSSSRLKEKVINVYFIGMESGKNLKRDLCPVENIKFEYYFFESIDDFLKKREKEDFFILVYDLPKINFKAKIDSLQTMGKMKIDYEVIVIHGDYSIQEITFGIKQGIYQFVEVPLKKREFSNLILEIALKKIICSKEKEVVKFDNYNFIGFIGKNRDLIEVYNSFEQNNGLKVALILGSRGIGKKKLTELLHFESKYRKGPFNHLNLNAIPKHLIDEKLFGDRKINKPGLLELSHEGTLSLENLKCLIISVQNKLRNYIKENNLKLNLFFISEEEIDNINEEMNLDLMELLKRNILKPKLLKNRRNDLPCFIKYFLKKFNRIHKKDLFFSSEAMDAFLRYDWPGNLTELENLIEKMTVVLEKEQVLLKDLPLNFLSHYREKTFAPYIEIGPAGLNLNGLIKNLERNLIEQALTKTNGNKNKASKLLSLNRTTLIEKMKKRGIGNKFPN